MTLESSFLALAFSPFPLVFFQLSLLLLPVIPCIYITSSRENGKKLGAEPF